MLRVGVLAGDIRNALAFGVAGLVGGTITKVGALGSILVFVASADAFVETGLIIAAIRLINTILGATLTLGAVAAIGGAGEDAAAYREK